VPEVVGVEEGDEAAVRGGDAGVARRGDAAVRLGDDAKARFPDHQAPRDAGRAVGRAVVDHDDLQPRMGLYRNRQDRVDDRSSRLKGRNHDRDQCVVVHDWSMRAA
jgi:hypothetical protein